MRLSRASRRWFAAAVVAAVLGVLALRALDSPCRLEYVRIGDEHTLIVGTSTGPGAWTRITGVAETTTTVTISVGAIRPQLGPGTAEAEPVELTVTLHDAIADRIVVDGSTGLVVPRTRCLPPGELAPGCTP